MDSNNSLSDLFKGLRVFSCAEKWALSSDKVRERPSRMEAIFYGSDGYQAAESMYHTGFSMEKVGDLSKILWFGPFTRKYVPEKGLPFLTSSKMMEAQPRTDKLISFKHTKHLDQLIIRDGYILVSCSGTIGNIMLCTKDIDGWACSQDAIRVIVNHKINLGVVYCYLQSPLGQFLLQRSQTGSVVRHIYEADVSSLPIPRLPLRLREELTKRIQEVSELRVEANRLLGQAEQMVQQQLELPDIEYFETPSEMQKNHNATIFSVQASNNIFGSNQFGRCRLDATYHDPAAVKLRAYLRENKQVKKLSDISTKIWRSNLRQRVYVDEKNYGVPLLNGKHLSLIRFNNLNYLSKLHTKKVSHEMVNQGYVLVTCGGTVGKVMFVYRNMDGYAVSEDVIRVKPNNEYVYGGFIYAFLNSPYGHIQLMQEEYGSVQKKLRDFHVGDILLPIPIDKGLSINEIIIAAFDKRADALQKEDAALDLFMTAIREGREATEAQWGSEE